MHILIKKNKIKILQRNESWNDLSKLYVTPSTFYIHCTLESQIEKPGERLQAPKSL